MKNNLLDDSQEESEENSIDDSQDEIDDDICPLCGGEGMLDEVLEIRCNLCKGKSII